MLRFFKKRKDKISLMYPVFQRLSSVIDKWQRKLAAWLENKAEKQSSKVKLHLFVLFCFLFGGGSIYLMVSAISSKNGKLFIQKISFPAYAVAKDSEASLGDRYILTESEHQNIERFKHYMDSLQQSSLGKLKYDSIMKLRPGLMDSIFFIEHLYHEQLKSK